MSVADWIKTQFNEPSVYDIPCFVLSFFFLWFFGRRLYIDLSKKNLTFEQKKLRATLMGGLGNIVLGAGIVSILLKMTGNIPIPFKSENVRDTFNYIYTILASVSVWCILHRYAVRLLDENSAAEKNKRVPFLASSSAILFALLAFFFAASQSLRYFQRRFRKLDRQAMRSTLGRRHL